MPETHIAILSALLVFFTLLALDVVLSRRRNARRESRGMLVQVAFFGLILGWALPRAVSEYGLAAGYGALTLTAVAITMTLFAKRLWILARRYDTRSQRVLVEKYYQDHGLAGLISVLNGWLWITIGAVLLHLIGSASSQLTGLGIFGFYIGIGVIVLSVMGWRYIRKADVRTFGDLIFFYVYLLGAVGLGYGVLDALGGFAGLGQWIEGYVSGPPEFPRTNGRGGGDFPVFLAIPGVYQDVLNVTGDFVQGGPWTGLMMLTATLCLVGLFLSQLWFGQVSAEPHTRGFASDHVVRVALLGAGIASVFGVASGLGIISGNGFGLFAGIVDGGSIQLGIIARAGTALFGLVIVSALIAVLLDAAEETGTSRNGKTPGSAIRRISGTGIAALLAFSPLIQLIDFATFAMALAAQLLFIVAGMCWLPWFTRRGVYAGLIGGIVAVLLTDFTGPVLQRVVLAEPLWGVSPLTMHAAGWGLLCNGLVCVVVSAATQSGPARAHRAGFHDCLQNHAPTTDEARGLIPVAWIFTISWVLFALGPGAVIGNSIFGAPDHGSQGWNFSIPSIWAWQIFMWAMGVALVWLLATRLGLSRPVEGTVKPISDDEKITTSSQEPG